ncbi:hypothetical protein IH981_01950, partial [Patescibacteria group bacterium]|nr:hypothetical protein [Patescibacteria group bacterium]
GIINKVRGFDPDEGNLEDKVVARLDHIIEIRTQAIREEDIERSERFGAASARLGEYLHKIQTIDAN